MKKIKRLLFYNILYRLWKNKYNSPNLISLFNNYKILFLKTKEDTRHTPNNLYKCIFINVNKSKTLDLFTINTDNFLN